MKKILSLLRYSACPVQDVLNRRLPDKTNRRRQHQRNHHPSFSSFLELGGKTVSHSQWRHKNGQVLNPASIYEKMDCSVCTLGIYTPLEARVLLTIIA